MPTYPYRCGCGAEKTVICPSSRYTPTVPCDRCPRAAARVFTVPHLGREQVFFHDAKWGGGQFEDSLPEVREAYLKPARDAGVSVAGKVYQHGLARFQGDPRAWVDSLGDARRTLEAEGSGCAELGLKARTDVPPPKPPPLTKRQVDEEIFSRVAQGLMDPMVTKKQHDEVRAEITPEWAPLE